VTARSAGFAGVSHAPKNPARCHPARAARVQLGHQRPEGSRSAPGTQADYALGPHAEAWNRIPATRGAKRSRGGGGGERFVTGARGSAPQLLLGTLVGRRGDEDKAGRRER